MEIIDFLTLFQVTQFVVGHVGSSCSTPNLWQLTIIIGLVAASGLILTSTGVGLVGIATTLVGLITAGASIDTIAATLASHLTVVGSSLGILTGLVKAI